MTRRYGFSIKYDTYHTYIYALEIPFSFTLLRFVNVSFTFICSFFFFNLILFSCVEIYFFSDLSGFLVNPIIFFFTISLNLKSILLYNLKKRKNLGVYDMDKKKTKAPVKVHQSILMGIKRNKNPMFYFVFYRRLGREVEKKK